jgi:hypothetical protein
MGAGEGWIVLRFCRNEKKNPRHLTERDVTTIALIRKAIITLTVGIVFSSTKHILEAHGLSDGADSHVASNWRVH